MARTKWLTYTQTGSGNSWEVDSYIYCPNANLEQDKAATLVQTKMVDGSNSYVSPETKFNYEPILFTFVGIDGDDEFITTMNDYVENQTYIKIVDHLGNEMEGIFTSIKEVWLLGEENSYDFQCNFLRIL